MYNFICATCGREIHTPFRSIAWLWCVQHQIWKGHDAYCREFRSHRKVEKSWVHHVRMRISQCGKIFKVVCNLQLMILKKGGLMNSQDEWTPLVLLNVKIIAICCGIILGAAVIALWRIR